MDFYINAIRYVCSTHIRGYTYVYSCVCIYLLAYIFPQRKEKKGEIGIGARHTEQRTDLLVRIGTAKDHPAFRVVWSRGATPLRRADAVRDLSEHFLSPSWRPANHAAIRTGQYRSRRVIPRYGTHQVGTI